MVGSQCRLPGLPQSLGLLTSRLLFSLGQVPINIASSTGKCSHSPVVSQWKRAMFLLETQ